MLKAFSRSDCSLLTEENVVFMMPRIRQPQDKVNPIYGTSEVPSIWRTAAVISKKAQLQRLTTPDWSLVTVAD